VSIWACQPVPILRSALGTSGVLVRRGLDDVKVAVARRDLNNTRGEIAGQLPMVEWIQAERKSQCQHASVRAVGPRRPVYLSLFGELTRRSRLENQPWCRSSLAFVRRPASQLAVAKLRLGQHVRRGLAGRSIMAGGRGVV